MHGPTSIHKGGPEKSRMRHSVRKSMRSAQRRNPCRWFTGPLPSTTNAGMNNDHLEPRDPPPIRFDPPPLFLGFCLPWYER